MRQPFSITHAALYPDGTKSFSAALEVFRRTIITHCTFNDLDPNSPSLDHHSTVTDRGVSRRRPKPRPLHAGGTEDAPGRDR